MLISIILYTVRIQRFDDGHHIPGKLRCTLIDRILCLHIVMDRTSDPLWRMQINTGALLLCLYDLHLDHRIAAEDLIRLSVYLYGSACIFLQDPVHAVIAQTDFTKIGTIYLAAELHVVKLRLQAVGQQVDPGKSFRGKGRAVVDKAQVLSIGIIFSLFHAVQHFTDIF